jgi:endonuclease YncB( thermonuclease family)
LFDYSVKLLEVVDGDTIKLDVDVGFRHHAFLTFRLARINAPEIVTLEGIASRTWLVERLAQVEVLAIHSTRQEKFGRWLCELYCRPVVAPGKPVTGGEFGGQVWECVNDTMLRLGLARLYSHGHAVGSGLSTVARVNS